MKKYGQILLVTLSTVLLGGCMTINNQGGVPAQAVQTNQDKAVEKNSSSFNESSNQETVKPSSTQEEIPAPAVTTTSLTSEVNQFVASYMGAMDVASKTGSSNGWASYFLNKNSETYQRALDDITNPNYKEFITTNSAATNISESGGVITFTTSFNRLIIFSDGSPNETVSYQRDWVLKRIDGHLYIDSYHSY